MSDSNQSGSHFWTLIVGGAIGLGVGLLIAPEKGQQIRRRIAFHLDNASKSVSEIVDKVSEIDENSEARRKADEVVENAQKAADEIMIKANELLSGGNGSVSKDIEDSAV